jgi:hypothetical protein
MEKSAANSSGEWSSANQQGRGPFLKDSPTATKTHQSAPASGRANQQQHTAAGAFTVEEMLLNVASRQA